MKIIKSKLFERFPEIVFGMSTKIGLDRKSPFYFNLSFTVGDSAAIVRENRNVFFNELGLDPNQVAYQKQIHSDLIKFTETPGLLGESDALITTKQNIGLAISTADCTPIFVYDPENKIIAAVHSGWRGTQKQILKKTIDNLINNFNTKAKNLFVYVGPSISQKNYEVGEEVGAQFDQKYIKNQNGRLYLDVLKANVDMLNDFMIPTNQIEVSHLCTYSEKELLHSFRRDGNFSGRSLGVIAMKSD
ncbi:MAG: peptidoglycan editing factor PgeF [Bacteroidota bacterium]